MGKEDEFMLPHEVARLLKYTVEHLAALRSQRRGPPYFKLGRGRASRVLYSRREVLAWIEGRRITGDESASDVSPRVGGLEL